MSVEIGVPSKSIRYLNLHKEGIPGENNFCHIDSRWTTPIIDSLSDYMVAVTRFEVPANRLTMTQELKNCIEVYRYPETDIDDDGLNSEFVEIFENLANAEDLDGSRQDSLDALDVLENEPTNKYCMTTGDGAHSIDVKACHTIYQFIKELNSQINEALLFNTGTKQFVPNGKGPPDHDDQFTQSATAGNATFKNMFYGNTSDPIAFFKIAMDSDWRFRVEMNYNFAQKYYIKFSRALFNMLGFKEGASLNKDDIRTDLAGRRFMASRKLGNLGMNQKPVYTSVNRQVVVYDRDPGTEVRVDLGALTFFIHRSINTSFTAPVSVADSINRIKSLVFTSSMATTSEGATGGTYFRMLTDYTIPVKTAFSFDPHTMATGTVNENAASEYTFTNANPSAGRFLQITDPSPLYELKLEVLAKAFNYETDTFEMVPIPLPVGGTFSVKLVFISKNEIHRREKPDQLKA